MLVATVQPVDQLGYGMDLIAAKLEIGCEMELTSDGGHAGFSCSLSSYLRFANRRDRYDGGR